MSARDVGGGLATAMGVARKAESFSALSAILGESVGVVGGAARGSEEVTGESRGSTLHICERRVECGLRVRGRTSGGYVGVTLGRTAATSLQDQ